MPGASDECNRLMEEFRAYLETLSFIQVDPMGCTVGAVAGLHAHGLKNLRKYLLDRE